jgi:hypothetical protein
MSLAMPVDGYGYRANTVIERLTPKHQREIEWLRVNRLRLYSENGKANVIGNYPDMEYQISVSTETLKVKLSYYLRASDGVVVIFAIE